MKPIKLQVLNVSACLKLYSTTIHHHKHKLKINNYLTLHPIWNFLQLQYIKVTNTNENQHIHVSLTNKPLQS